MSRSTTGNKVTTFAWQFFRLKKFFEVADIIFEQVKICRVIIDAKENCPHLHSKSQTLCYIGEGSGANTWMHTTRQFLAWGYPLRQ